MYESNPRWIRGYSGNTTVVESKRSFLVWEGPTNVPKWSFYKQDIKGLKKSGTRAEGRWVGQYYDIVNGDRVHPRVAWTYRQDVHGAPSPDQVTVSFQALDAWYEEEEQVYIHPRSPYVRTDIRASSRHIVVSLDNVVLAETRNAILLFENALPTRYYINPQDVTAALLHVHAAYHTGCPYKGTASYWSAQISGKVYPDIAWAYPEPLEGLERIRNRWCFYNEKVDIVIDGEHLARPVTHFS